tara:strand:- start:63254 stop:64570 length:1317 start_codon:yes stop_codon:yes gene_type:complete
VADQAGDISLLKEGVAQPTTYFSVSNLLTPLGLFGNQTPFGDYDERGLLGLAFHPDFAAPGQPGYGKFYTHTSETNAGAADFTVPLSPGTAPDHQAVVREWTVDPTLDDVTASAVGREVMRVDQPQFNHNGGALVFGPDRNLYIGFGDGGGANDNNAEGHGPNGNGANIETVHGSILRIDPLGTNSGNGQYGNPVDNPFVGGSGLDEIYAYGLRNPFGFGFDVDPATGLATPSSPGTLIVPDVGQNQIEEVNVVQLGDDLGWRYKEGTFFFDPDNPNDLSENPIPGVTPNGFTSVDPVLQYDHDEGATVISGFVYRGTEIPELDGKYVFADWGKFDGSSGRLFYGDLTTGEINELIIGFDDRALDGYVKGFGRGPDGELYVLAGPNLGPFRDGTDMGFGSVLKIVNAGVAVPEPSSLTALAMMSTMVIVRRRSRRVPR